MKRALDLSWVVMLALLLSGALVVGCGGDKKDDDEDTSVDVESDMEDTAMDTIPEPSTEPPMDTTMETEEDVPEDVPWDGEGGGVGDACTGDEECGGVPSTSSYCMTDIGGYVPFPGGYCTADCTSSADCGPDAECLDLYIMAVCVKMCDENADCRESEGYECAEPPFVGGGPYCIPIFDMPESPTDVSTDVDVPDSEVDATDAVTDTADDAG